MKAPLPFIHPPARRSKPLKASTMAGITLAILAGSFAAAWLVTWLVCEVSNLNR